MDRKQQMTVPSIKTPIIMDGKQQMTVPSIKTPIFMDRKQQDCEAIKKPSRRTALVMWMRDLITLLPFQ